MTQKSHNRQMRDRNKRLRAEQEKRIRENLPKIREQLTGGWAELDEMFYRGKALLAHHADLGRILNNKLLIAEISDHSTFGISVRQLTSDIRQLDTELQTIRSQHVGKSGDLTDDDIISLSCISIVENYGIWTQRATALLAPNTNLILEMSSEAEVNLQKKVASGEVVLPEAAPQVVVEEAAPTNLVAAAATAEVTDVQPQ